MTPDDNTWLADDLAATACISVDAARLLLRLSEGPVRRQTLASARDRAALTTLQERGTISSRDGWLRVRPAGWRVMRVDVDGLRLCVQTCGDGEALVLAPPFGAYRNFWGLPWPTAERVPTDSQLGAFSSRYRTVCIDYRGTGCSDISDGPYSLELFANDLDVALDRLEIVRAHLLGASIGAAIVLRMALARPERAASLILCAGAAGEIDAATRVKAETFLGLLRREQRSLDWAMRTYLRTPIAGATRERIDSMLDVGRRSVRTLDNFVNLYRANVFRASVQDRLGALRLPTLVMVGEHDVPFFREEAHRLAQDIVGAELVTVPGAGHLCSEQNPAFFNRAVLDFLARQEARRPCVGH